MRYIAIALTLCFMLAPLEAKTHSTTRVVRMKKNKYKARKAPRRHKSTARYN